MASSTNDDLQDRHPENEWKYDADGLSARTIDGSAEITLENEAASPLGDDVFTPFVLHFCNSEFTAVIPVQRYWYRKHIDFGGQTKIYPYWKVVYDACIVGKIGRTKAAASSLARAEWISLDRQMFNALGAWPGVRGESDFRKGVELLVVKSVWGGQLSNGWNPNFVRNVGFFKSPTYAFPGESSPLASRTLQALSEIRRSWIERTIQNRAGIVNSHNGDTLCFSSRESIKKVVPTWSGDHDYYLLEFATSGMADDSRLVPVGYSPDTKLFATWSLEEASLLDLRNGSSWIEAVKRTSDNLPKTHLSEDVDLDGGTARWDWYLRFIEASLSWPHSIEYSVAQPPAAIDILRARAPRGRFQRHSYSATIFPFLFAEFDRPNPSH